MLSYLGMKGHDVRISVSDGLNKKQTNKSQPKNMYVYMWERERESKYGIMVTMVETK